MQSKPRGIDLPDIEGSVGRYLTSRSVVVYQQLLITITSMVRTFTTIFCLSTTTGTKLISVLWGNASLTPLLSLSISLNSNQ